ncbi:MAG: autotransporter-associated beta strand repeat-containing protein, partial [Planctomycetes bacterium]|nr:autotransporter-associated beta strand repeat-containing protein [Planctomycetota bacterium]
MQRTRRRFHVLAALAAVAGLLTGGVARGGEFLFEWTGQWNHGSFNFTFVPSLSDAELVTGSQLTGIRIQGNGVDGETVSGAKLVGFGAWALDTLTIIDAGTNGTVVFDGTGTFAYGGDLQITTGGMQINVDSNATFPTSRFTLVSDTVLTITGSLATASTIDSLDSNFATSNVDLQNVALTLSGGKGIASDFAGKITGSGSIVIDGGITQSFSGDSTYNGGTTIRGGGKLTVGRDESLGLSGVVLDNPYGELTLENGTLKTTGTFQMDRRVIANNGTLEVDAGTTLTLTGNLTDSLSKTGEGTLKLQNSSISSVTLTQEAGIVDLNTAASPGLTYIQNGGTLLAHDGYAFRSAIFKGILDVPGELTFNQPSKFDGATIKATKETSITGAGTVEFDGAPTVVEFDAAGADDGEYNLITATSFTGSNVSDLLSMIPANLGTGKRAYSLVGSSRFSVKVFSGTTDLTWAGTAFETSWSTSESDRNWTVETGGSNVYFKNGDSVLFTDAATVKDITVAAGGVEVGSMAVTGTGYAFNVTAGSSPAIKADTTIAFGGATLNITGYTPDETGIPAEGYTHRQTVLEAGTSITGFNGTVSVAGQPTADFLVAQARQISDPDDGKEKVVVETSLTWYSEDPSRKAHGDFEIMGGNIFTLGAKLADNDTSSNLLNPWDGKSLTKKGTGTLVLTAANEYTGDTTIEAGTLSLKDGGSIADSSEVKLDGTNVAALDISEATSSTVDIKKLSGGGANATVVLGGNTLRVGNGLITTDSRTFSGILSGAGNLEKAGDDTLTLEGVNEYTGTTTISGGTLALSGDGSIAESSSVQFTGLVGSTLDVSGVNAPATINNLSSATNSGEIVLGSKTLNIVNTGDTSFGGLFMSAAIRGEMSKSGLGTLTLSGSSTDHFRGTMRRTDGEVDFTNSNGLANGSFMQTSGELTTGSATKFKSGVFSGTLTPTETLTLGSATFNGATIKMGLRSQIVVIGTATFTGLTHFNFDGAGRDPGAYELLTSTGLTG